MIRYVFLHLDGVILQNILVPIIQSIVHGLGGKYSAEVENNVLSRSQAHAAEFLIRHFNLQLSKNEVIELYNRARERFIQAHEIRPREGLKEFLLMLKAGGYRVVAYGGADREYFLTNVGECGALFDDDGYIQTRDIRPGVRQIIHNIYAMDCREALFIDETAVVAQEAKADDVPFIGMCTGHDVSFQKQEMEVLGVKYFVHSLQDVDLPTLARVERDAQCLSLWK